MKQRINQMLDNSEQLNKPPFMPEEWEIEFDKRWSLGIRNQQIKDFIKQTFILPKLSLCSDEPKVGCKWCLCVKNNGRCKCSCHNCKQCKK